ncbi:2-polyprenyl-6-methoxyphenol hydroxylase [Aneurinibacillus thermoaerophilus]|uniref:2-polyprenyl-6-methoxyphenol hydroxylase n=2 Tax=Aneurinibacillus thermoaerophilus TaxID=143495 RepID=A0A1G7Y1L4_ANETH|nr:FAD-dependent monooxygenase [Aneurinibacillus thermoaerophilus]MED0677818.1 FAD-dependent monooxygenase [Aneurinibacillus thermoaerophilus]MED0762894.1 FAD-dependent monooxygenase [Aneurinibacillus thermoaerophilus]SDG90319.1 2-polyprenyl-6-methoxyphenol hydroxylase [Aneurinibacillus thermoaerophilus]
MKSTEMSKSTPLNRFDVDVVVVGAGPGGCMLSYLLARSGVKTALLERHNSLDREFRGYFFQPLVLKLFDQLGLLEDILRIPHERVDMFKFVDHGKTLFEVRFDELEPPYNYGLNISQPPLLEYFIQQSSRFSNFTYFGGTTAKNLIKRGDSVHGILAINQEEEIELHSRLVVGADGRYSTIRKLADISQTMDKFEFDFVWFDMPKALGKDYPLQIKIEDEGMLIYIPKGEDQVQVGWVIKKKTYPELVKKGIDDFIRTLIVIEPDLQDVLPYHLKSFKQCSVLDIQVGMTDTWVRDGLLLLGDAAHIASPFSGQGNSLAIQDAVIAHDSIMKAMTTQGSGVLQESFLKNYELYRKPAVAEIQRIQAMQARLIAIKNPTFLGLRRTVAPVARRTSLFKKMRDKIAMGVQKIEVNTSFFLSQES